jgi:RND superfamily putative drug exporter
MLKALVRLAAHWRIVLSVTILAVVALVLAGRGASARLLNGGTQDPSAQSSRASAILGERFPSSMANLVLLVHPATGGRTVDNPLVRAEGSHLAAELAQQRGVVGVTSYWQAAASSLRSGDGKYALIVARIQGDDTRIAAMYTAIAPRFEGARGPVIVQLGGAAAVNDGVRSTIKADLKRAEIVVLPITLIILILAFGSVVAALLPLALGVLSIVGTDAALKLITEFTSVSIFAQNLTTALGLGLAIDYALFIVRRFREERRGGLETQEAIAVTLRTAGRTVVFSAFTVAVALSVMLLFPQFFLRSFAYAGISVVLFAALSAVTVLPALLAALGPRVDAWDLRRLLRPRPRAGSQAARTSGWGRLANGVMRRAPFAAVATVALLAVLGLPFLGVKFGTADYRQLPSSAGPRVVQQVILDDFTSNPEAVIDVLAEHQSGGGAAALATYAARISRLSGVHTVSGPGGSYAHGRQVAPAAPADAARTSGGDSFLSVVLSVPGISPQSEHLVSQIRALRTPFPALVAGDAAEVTDSTHAIGTRLFLAGGIIALTTLILVFLLTGSLLIPVLAIVLSVLSLSATFGAVVWVFQDGHLSGLLGFTATGFIDETLPVLMFCVAFGLSMDYSVFLLSRIKEEIDRGSDNRAAIAFGLERTGGIITTAALILAVVLVAIGTSHITNIKMLGLGAALAVLVDALVVRCLLVPSVLSLTGRATWWAPAPLARFQSRFGLRDETPGRAAPAGERPSGGIPAGGPAAVPGPPAREGEGR